MIEPLYYKLNFAEFYPSDDFFTRYYGLDSKKQFLIHNILERIYFIDIVKESEESLTNRLIWNLRMYLLLSSSDALGKGASYYSFGNYLADKHLPDRDIIINDFINSGTIDSTTYLDSVKCLYLNYQKQQSVKQSFHNYWDSRSLIMKEKLSRCLTCLNDNSFIDYSILITNYFYKLFRNEFTHSAKSNLPELADFEKRIRYNKGGNSEFSIVEAVINNKVLVIKTPITDCEKEMLIKNKASFYAKRVRDDKRISIQHKEQNIDFFINSNFGYIQYTEIGENKYSINSAIIEVVKLSIIEGLFKLIDVNIDWIKYYEKKYFVQPGL